MDDAPQPGELEFEELFDDPGLDPRRWVPHYLPHWSTPERSAARFELTEDGLALRIDADQPAWRAEDGLMRVSNLQSGSWSGPLGSPRGQHRHRPDLAVTTPQPTRRLYAPTGGRIEATLRASTDPSTMLAFWLVGFEDESAQDSGEICVAELYGSAIGIDAVGGAQSTVNVGIKAHHDPRLSDEMAEVALPMDASQWHTYSVDWAEDRIGFYVDDRLIHQSSQRIGYPMQLMLDLFEFPASAARDPDGYPKIGRARSVRGYRRV